MEKMELMDELQVHYKDFVKRMKGRVSYDDYETQSLLEGYTEELASFISEELDKAREDVLIELQKEFSEFGVPDDVRYTQPLFYINEVIEKKLSKLKTKEDEK